MTQRRRWQCNRERGIQEPQKEARVSEISPFSVLFSLLLISCMAAAEDRCDRDILPAVDGQPRYPIFEQTQNVKGTVNLRFHILSDGRAQNIKVLSSSSSVFERAATTYLESSRFPKVNTTCIHELTVVLEMKSRVWAVASRVPERSED